MEPSGFEIPLTCFQQSASTRFVLSLLFFTAVDPYLCTRTFSRILRGYTWVKREPLVVYYKQPPLQSFIKKFAQKKKYPPRYNNNGRMSIYAMNERTTSLLAKGADCQGAAADGLPNNEIDGLFSSEAKMFYTEPSSCDAYGFVFFTARSSWRHDIIIWMNIFIDVVSVSRTLCIYIPFWY